MLKPKSISSCEDQKGNDLFPLDIIVGKLLVDNEIIRACADVFSLSSSEVALVDDLSSYVNLPESSVQLFCERTSISGDFRLFLSLFPQNTAIEKRAEQIGGVLDIAQAFCKLWRCKCLIKDNSPFEDYEEDAYYLLQEGVNPQLVYIDLDQLDENIFRVLPLNTK